MIEKITNFLLKLGYTKEDIAKNLELVLFSTIWRSTARDVRQFIWGTAW